MTIDGVEIILLARRGNVQLGSSINEAFLTEEGHKVVSAMKFAVNQSIEVSPDKFIEGTGI